MLYRLFMPANYDPSVDYPSVLILHGINGRGTDNVNNFLEGRTEPTHFWSNDSTQVDNPSFLIVPQCPPDRYWTATLDTLKALMDTLCADIADTCLARGACCTDTACDIMTEVDCTAGGGVYAGTGVVCDVTTCTPGACCMLDGTCVDDLDVLWDIETSRIFFYFFEGCFCRGKFGFLSAF